MKVRNVEPWKLKAPLIFMTMGAGLLGSISLSFVKGLTEALRVDGLGGGVMFYIYTAIALFIGIMQLNILNKSMELYDQVDTIPIYQSSLILLNIASGAIVMQESKLYTPDGFLILVLCGFISIAGVWIIIKKPTSSAKQEDTNSEEMTELSCPFVGSTSCTCK